MNYSMLYFAVEFLDKVSNSANYLTVPRQTGKTKTTDLALLPTSQERRNRGARRLQPPPVQYFLRWTKKDLKFSGGGNTLFVILLLNWPLEYKTSSAATSGFYIFLGGNALFPIDYAIGDAGNITIFRPPYMQDLFFLSVVIQ